MRIIAINLIVLAATMILAEAAVRLLHLAPAVYSLNINSPSSPLKLSDDPQLGYEYIKNFIPEPNTEKQTNNFGFRDRDRQIEKKINFKRVAMIGDSVLDGNFSEALVNRSMGIFDYKNLLAHQVELQNRQMEVLNFSVNGYCTANEAAMAAKTIKPFAPDLVLINFVDNDFDGCFGMLLNTRNGDHELLEFLFKNSELFRLLSLRFDLFEFNKNIELRKTDDKMVFFSEAARAKADELKTYLQKLNPSFNDKEYSDAFNYFFNLSLIAKKRSLETKVRGYDQVKNSLRMIQQTFNGIPIVLTIWPVFQENEFLDRNYDRALLKPFEGRELTIEKICRELNIKSVRLSQIFSRRFKHSLPNKDFTISDGTHLNEKGAKALAPVFSEIIKDNL